MNKGLPLLGLLAAVILVSGCIGIVQNIPCEIGSENVISQDFTFSEFHSLDNLISADVYLTQDTEQSVRVEAEDNIIEMLRMNVQDEKLSIRSGQCFSSTRPVNIYISMKEVEELSNSASGDIIGQAEIVSDTLKLDVTGSGSTDLDLDAYMLETIISGSGDLILGGVADNHTSEISGSGSMKAFDFQTQKASIRSSGSGNAEVSVSEELDVIISGSGSIFYRGDPVITQTITGSGRLIKA